MMVKMSCRTRALEDAELLDNGSGKSEATGEGCVSHSLIKRRERGLSGSLQCAKRPRKAQSFRWDEEGKRKSGVELLRCPAASPCSGYSALQSGCRGKY